MRTTLFGRLCAVACGLLMVFGASAALAQGPPPGGPGRGGPGFGGPGGPGGGRMMRQMGMVMLLRAEQVQKELKLTEEQVAELSKLREQFRPQDRNRQGREDWRNMSEEERAKRWKEMQEEGEKRMKEMMDKLTAILSPEQMKRLRQIQMQLEGATVLLQPEIAKELGLTDEQNAQLKKLADDAQEEMRKMWQAGRGEGRGEGGERRGRGEGWQQMREKMDALVKEGQKKAMAVLTAEQRTKLAEMMGEPFKLDMSALRPRAEGRRGDGPRGQGGRRQRPPEGGQDNPGAGEPI